MTDSINWQQAFEIASGEVVSFIGAGGKTSLMVSLGYELAEAGMRVLATTTISMHTYQLDLMPNALPIYTDPDLISQALNEGQFVFLYTEIQEQQVFGVTPEAITHLLDAVDSDVMLVEADYANNLPLKAPLDGEPNIPDETTLIIPVVSLSALGQPIDNAHVYNADAMIARYGFQSGSPIKSPWLAQVLRDAQLGMRGVPDGPRVVAFLNRTPPKGYDRMRARRIARLALKSPRLNGVVLGSVRGAETVHEIQRPVGAVVLAAGLSTRMGEPKVLLPWEGSRTIIEHIVYQLIKSRIDHIVVVTGHQSREVKEILKPYDVKVVYNRAYKTGEMLSSLKAGLRAMPDHVAASLMVLGDQPGIQPKVIYRLLSQYAEGTGDLLIPSYRMRRGHPILIGRRYWGEILSMRRHESPRAFIDAHDKQITYVKVDTDSILRDVDTPQDYREERLRSKG